MWETRQELALVCPFDIKFCDPGDDVVLLCHLEPAISAASMEINWRNRADLVCHYKDGQMTVSREYEGRVSLSLEDLHNGNVSLTLRDVRTSQKGLYICEVINEWQSIKEYIFLHISSEDFSLVVPTGTISAYPGSDVTLPAYLSPETSAVAMKIKWFKGTDLIYHYNNCQEITNSDYENRLSLSIQELQRGNLSMILRNVQPSDSGDYTCKVFLDGCLQTGTVHLQVRDLLLNIDDPLEPLQDIVKQIHEEFLQIKPDLSEKALKLLQEALDDKDKTRRKKSSVVEEDCTTETEFTEGPKLRSRSSTELIPPYMGEDSTSETEFTEGPTLRSRSSTELIPPFMGEQETQFTEGPTLRSRSIDEIPLLTAMEFSVQNTRQTREVNTATEQRFLTPVVTSLVLQRERTTVNAIMQTGQERRQESVATEQESSSSTVQSQVQERESPSQSDTSQAGRRAQSPQRPENRTQRRPKSTEKKCHIL